MGIGDRGASASCTGPRADAWGSVDRRSAFTLVELLIVISVMILLFAVAVPGVSKLLNAGREDSALGAMGAAIATARSFAGRNLPMPPGVTYQGTALIVCPANELRVVEHYADKTVGSVIYNCYRDTTYRVSSVSGESAREGYISVPKGVGLVGIVRDNDVEPTLLAPPFALRFDQHGHLIVRQPGTGGVVYDGNYQQDPNSAFDQTYYWAGRYSDGLPYTRGQGGANGYDPSYWDPERSGKIPGTSLNRDSTTANFHSAAQKYMLPFETMETAIGVIAFNKETLYKQFPNAMKAVQANAKPPAASPNLDSKVRDWLLANGRVMFFNRYSGAVIKP